MGAVAGQVAEFIAVEPASPSAELPPRPAVAPPRPADARPDSPACGSELLVSLDEEHASSSSAARETQALDLRC